MVQKKAKGGGGEVGQRAEGGEKRCSSAFLSAFSSANPTRDLRRSCFLITFFLSQQFEGAWIAVEDLLFFKALSINEDLKLKKRKGRDRQQHKKLYTITRSCEGHVSSISTIMSTITAVFC